ncbi:MAG TPA: Hsp20/alpha crystallin family protein [Propionibacteriaceae bacterium]|nr:Hsp20/alpha crystallin family protein [Propionibacteriaceae bacterium]
MAVMTRWDAFHDLRATQDQLEYLNRMFVQARGQELGMPGSGTVGTPAWAPPVDISERKDAYIVEVELPGARIGDLQIAFQDGLLTIQGERCAPPDSVGEQVHLSERRYGPFRRSITLPPHVRADAIEASLDEGVLRMMLPKAEEAKPRSIEVRTARPRTPALADAPHGIAPGSTPN